MQPWDRVGLRNIDHVGTVTQTLPSSFRPATASKSLGILSQIYPHAAGRLMTIHPVVIIFLVPTQPKVPTLTKLDIANISSSSFHLTSVALRALPTSFSVRPAIPWLG